MMRWLVLVVSVIILAAAWLVWSKNSSVASQSTEDINAQMENLAKKAVGEAKQTYSTVLDYQPSSVKHVEAILSRLHQKHQARPYTDKQLADEAYLWGAYIGEVIRRVRPGRWQRDSVQAGKGTLPVVHGEEDEAYPCGWVYKQITNGPEDDVWSKFQLTYMRESLKELKLGGE